MDISNDITLMKIRYSQTTQQLPTDKLKGSENAKQYNQKLRAAADGFEELFVHQLLQVMRESVPKTNLLDGGRGEEIFQDMLDEEYAKIITENRAFGLSNIIFEANKKPDK